MSNENNINCSIKNMILNYNLTNEEISDLKKYVTLNYSTFDFEKSDINKDIYSVMALNDKLNYYLIHKNDKDLTNRILRYLENLLTNKVKINKRFNIEDIDYYIEFASIKALETYDESCNLELYAFRWLKGFVDKTVNEDSKILVLK